MSRLRRQIAKLDKERGRLRRAAERNPPPRGGFAVEKPGPVPADEVDDAWDLEMKRDAAAGRLDFLAEEADREYAAGITKKL